MTLASTLSSSSVAMAIPPLRSVASTCRLRKSSTLLRACPLEFANLESKEEFRREIGTKSVSFDPTLQAVPGFRQSLEHDRRAGHVRADGRFELPARPDSTTLRRRKPRKPPSSQAAAYARARSACRHPERCRAVPANRA